MPEKEIITTEEFRVITVTFAFRRQLLAYLNADERIVRLKGKEYYLVLYSGLGKKLLIRADHKEKGECSDSKS